jgi:hypothetical protein
MTYALAVLVGLQAVVIVYLVDTLTRRARDERKELEDRLMAMSNMDALILHKAHEDTGPGAVTYVDEQREWELSPGGGGDGE